MLIDIMIQIFYYLKILRLQYSNYLSYKKSDTINNDFSVIIYVHQIFN